MSNNTNQTTRQIAGHAITLTNDTWYIASRPIATRRDETYPITISNDANDAVLTIPDLTYDDANDFLAAFNNGDSSFDGRIW